MAVTGMPRSPEEQTGVLGHKGRTVAGTWEEVSHPGENICLMNKSFSAMFVKYRTLPKQPQLLELYIY